MGDYRGIPHLPRTQDKFNVSRKNGSLPVKLTKWERKPDESLFSSR